MGNKGFFLEPLLTTRLKKYKRKLNFSIVSKFVAFKNNFRRERKKENKIF